MTQPIDGTSAAPRADTRNRMLLSDTNTGTVLRTCSVPVGLDIYHQARPCGHMYIQFHL